MAIAIIKPDHLGDLILSAAAIRAISAKHDAVTLFVAPSNIGLAEVLFPDLDVQAVTFRHLSKGEHATGSIPDLRNFDWVAFLRNDQVINEKWAALRARRFVVPTAGNTVHQTIIDYSVASVLVGSYEIDALHFGKHQRDIEAKASRNPARIGLSIGSGFHTNRWATSTWIDLASLLQKEGLYVKIICGPKEIDRARFIVRMAGLDEAANMLVGNSDFQSFWDEVDTLDQVVATDGGTAHLCSMRVPILSIFGPSPFLRYAPFGRHNRVLTRNLSCAPCCQYTNHLVNGCLSMECLALIDAQKAFAALTDSRLRTSRPQMSHLAGDVQLVFGPSHISRGSLIDAVTI